ncbi:MAG: hypothetical protein LQ352_003327 [Teloschistes flavicans]|nr:MAG: hypothetical protein LQ352_003327 [Teloschistes flavicans]
MASQHASLNAAATERKARLAKLNSLKRKQPNTAVDELAEPALISTNQSTDLDPASPMPSVTTTYLSGRNYDPTTRGPKLGFESAPSENAETLENRAAQIAQETRDQEAKEDKEDKPIDLFKLQPKKPNWDLKRDLARKMETLNVRTDNAIARLVRERIENVRQKNTQRLGTEGDTDFGWKGEELVEGVHLREREEEEEEKRERETVDMVE